MADRRLRLDMDHSSIRLNRTVLPLFRSFLGRICKKIWGVSESRQNGCLATIVNEELHSLQIPNIPRVILYAQGPGFPLSARLLKTDAKLIALCGGCYSGKWSDSYFRLVRNTWRRESISYSRFLGQVILNSEAYPCKDESIYFILSDEAGRKNSSGQGKRC